MLSKCANPECSQVLRYLHEGKIFCLSPTPEVLSVKEVPNPAFEERFWLCERCSKEMTLVWGGTQVKLVSLPVRVAAPALPLAAKEKMRRRRSPTRAAPVGREDK